MFARGWKRRVKMFARGWKRRVKMFARGWKRRVTETSSDCRNPINRLIPHYSLLLVDFMLKVSRL